MSRNSVCVLDFCGTYQDKGFHAPCSYWADYYPDENQVIFGGDFASVPDMVIDHEPTEEECMDWVHKNGGFWWDD